jgi:hypothetical protein
MRRLLWEELNLIFGLGSMRETICASASRFKIVEETFVIDEQ